MANAITSFATLLAGVVTLALWAALPGQPRRWAHAYLWIVLTGIPTLGLHAYGEPFRAPSHPWWSVADTGSNLILAWAFQVAVLGDFWSRRVQRRAGAASLCANLLAIGWMIRERFFADGPRFLIPLGEIGGFTAGEVTLILDALLVVALLYRSREHWPSRARPVLHVATALFLCGLALATAANPRVGTLFGVRVLAWHALWHLVGAFGFLALFVFNHVRFAESGPSVKMPELARRTA
jgi:hypothetical protein